MSNPPKGLRPDYEALAAAGTTLRGRIDARELSGRLAAALCVPAASGAVDYELAFSRGSAAAVAVSGNLRARLAACCQRCLGPVGLDLEVPVRLLIPASEPTRDDPDWDVAETGSRPTLADLLEEELLLALPFAPRHPDPSCTTVAGEYAAAPESGRKSFADLAELLHRDRD